MNLEQIAGLVTSYAVVGIPLSIYWNRTNEYVSPVTWFLATVLWPVVLAFHGLIWFVQTEFKNPFYRE